MHGPGHPCLSIEAGTAYNVVPAKASYSGHLLAGVIAELDQLGFDYETKDDQVTVLGISARQGSLLRGQCHRSFGKGFGTFRKSSSLGLYRQCSW